KAYDRYFGDDGEYASTNAFVERNSPDGGDIVWIHEERGNAGTTIHEAMHLYSNASFRSTYGTSANEGTTEYFTRKITGKLKIERANYDDEYKGVVVLAAATSDGKLAEAYFNGALDALRTAAGGDKFDKWLKAMKDKKWSEAANAFK